MSRLIQWWNHPVDNRTFAYSMWAGGVYTGVAAIAVGLPTWWVLVAPLAPVLAMAWRRSIRLSMTKDPKGAFLGDVGHQERTKLDEGGGRHE